MRRFLEALVLVEPVRTDGPASRALCALEMNLADRSSFFTWVTTRIRRSPALLRLLYGPDLAWPGRGPRIDPGGAHCVGRDRGRAAT
jgi:hypothetical protein